MVSTSTGDGVTEYRISDFNAYFHGTANPRTDNRLRLAPVLVEHPELAKELIDVTDFSADPESETLTPDK
jgi:hypothetical protein